MIGLSRRKHLYESHCLALQWLPLRAVTPTRIAAQSTSGSLPIIWAHENSAADACGRAHIF